jgi:hypothetical protein
MQKKQYGLTLCSLANTLEAPAPYRKPLYQKLAEVVYKREYET